MGLYVKHFSRVSKVSKLESRVEKKIEKIQRGWQSSNFLGSLVTKWSVFQLFREQQLLFRHCHRGKWLLLFMSCHASSFVPFLTSYERALQWCFWNWRSSNSSSNWYFLILWKNSQLKVFLSCVSADMVFSRNCGLRFNFMEISCCLSTADPGRFSIKIHGPDLPEKTFAAVRTT